MKNRPQDQGRTPAGPVVVYMAPAHRRYSQRPVRDIDPEIDLARKTWTADLGEAPGELPGIAAVESLHLLAEALRAKVHSVRSQFEIANPLKAKF